MKHLIDKVLIQDAKKLVSLETKTTAEVISYLEEIDRRRLYADFGYSSMIKFCVKELGYSEGSAYRRLNSARLSRQVEVLPFLHSGELTPTNAAMAQDFFKAEGIKDPGKKKDVISGILGKSKREAEEALKKQSSPQSPFRRKSILRRATTTDWDLTVTISDELKLKLEKIRSLKSHSTKTWEDVLDAMADLALKELTKVRTPRATTTRSRAPTPAMKNQLMRQADYRCQHPGCDGTAFLQVDHVVPVSRGGRTEMRNLRVLCAAHNLRKGH